MVADHTAGAGIFDDLLNPHSLPSLPFIGVASKTTCLLMGLTIGSGNTLRAGQVASHRVKPHRLRRQGTARNMKDVKLRS